MSHWKRISLELSRTWPGKMLLRFEAADGPATMVEVDWGDLATIAALRGAASDEDRIRDAMAEAQDHPGRVVTR